MTDPTVVQPYPWATLASTTRAEEQALRQARRWARQRVDLVRVPSVLGELLGVEVAVLERDAHAWTSAAGPADGVGVLLAPAEHAEVGRGALVLAEAALVAAILRRVARRPTRFSFDPAAPLSAGAAGGFAAVVAAVLRRAHGDGVLRVLAAGPARDLGHDLARRGTPLVAINVTVLVAHDAYLAQVVVPERISPSLPLTPWGTTALAAMGPTPLDVPVVACAFALASAEVSRLRRGDVVLLPEWPLEKHEGALIGPVLLAAGDGDLGLSAVLGGDGRLVLRGDEVPLGPTEASMGEGVEKSAWVDAIGDVPVLVRVEIGEARMAARDWASIGRGDVVALGRRVGEPVVLRVGGVRVARGELVEIEGEVGVRVLERLGDDAGGA